MDDTNDTPGELHPEELLASYVDGTATAAERAEVDAHLEGCARCRDEVRLARSAYRALVELPEVEPITVAAGVIHMRPRRRTWLATGAGLAAAAAIVAGFIAFINVGGGSPATGGAAAPAASAPASVAPKAVSTPDLAALTQQLAGGDIRSAAGTLTESRGPVATAPGFQNATGSEALDAPAQTISCAAGAAGLSRDAQAIFGQAIVLDGTPAWAVGYRIPAEGSGLAHVVLVAVARDGCRVLYLARAPVTG